MKIKQFFNKLWLFTKKHRWSALLITATLIVGGFFVWDSYTANTDIDFGDVVIPKKKEPELFAAPYSGIKVPESQLKKRPIAVMIENHPDSRPQSGLNEADIIFEAVAEGGITRFLAIFQSRESQEIGPVRSARNYYVEWTDSYDALYAYVGGSVEALSLVNRLGVADLNQFSLGGYFWRSTSRYAPHNVYTTTEKLRAAAEKKGYDLEFDKIIGYQFKEDAEAELRPEAQKFTVGFNSSFAPTYIYNASCNCYNRSLLGVIQKDKVSGEKIEAKNVVVAFSQVGGRLIRGQTYTTINTTGSGQAHIYLDGQIILGTWKRTAGLPIRFYDPEGEEIELNVGTTWVDVVGIGTKVF